MRKYDGPRICPPRATGHPLPAQHAKECWPVSLSGGEHQAETSLETQLAQIDGSTSEGQKILELFLNERQKRRQQG